MGSLQDNWELKFVCWCVHACVDGYLSVCGPAINCRLVKDVTPGYSTSAGIENE